MNEKLKEFGKADNLRGIRVRTRIAIICALCFIAIYTLFVSFNYDSIPNLVPEFHDADGVLIKAVHKAAFFRYGFEFILLFLLTILVTRIIRPFFKEQIIYARTRCMIFDIVNLYITTAGCITMILFAFAQGDESEELSYFSQSMILLFWALVMIVEYVFDLKKIRKNAK